MAWVSMLMQNWPWGGGGGGGALPCSSDDSPAGRGGSASAVKVDGTSTRDCSLVDW